MLEELKREYERTRRVSVVGALVMYLVAVASALILLLYLYAIVATGTTGGLGAAWPIAALVSLSAFVLSNLLLGRFLWCFGKGAEPFGERQARRLYGAAILLALKLAGTAAFPSFDSVEVISGSLSLASQPQLDLQAVTLIALLLCMAMAMRYGNALKEDSDSIA